MTTYRTLGEAMVAAGYTKTIAAGDLYFDPQAPRRDVVRGLFNPLSPNASGNRLRYGFTAHVKGPVVGPEGASPSEIATALERGWLAGLLPVGYQPTPDDVWDILYVEGRTRPSHWPHNANVHGDLLAMIVPPVVPSAPPAPQPPAPPPPAEPPPSPPQPPPPAKRWSPIEQRIAELMSLGDQLMRDRAYDPPAWQQRLWSALKAMGAARLVLYHAVICRRAVIAAAEKLGISTADLERGR